MTTRMETEIDMGNMPGRKGGVEKDGIMIVHDGIILTIHEEDRGTVYRNMTLEGEAVTEQTVTRTTVTEKATS